MVKNIVLAVTAIVVFSAGAISAQQLRTSPKALGVCHGTCSLNVTCFAECFCYKGQCVSQLPPQERSNQR
jgi:hypothetical protein